MKQKPKLALISSGFLRNYQFFLQHYLYKTIIDLYDCDIYISTWNEDGYGSHMTREARDYSNNIITQHNIKNNFGYHLKYLKRMSFSEHQQSFTYSPVKNLLGKAPQGLEKYRSKFFCLSQIEISNHYDIYFHIRLDLQCDNAYDLILKYLNIYKKEDNIIYTSQDMFNRPNCFGDSYQIFNYDDFKFLQNFYNKLYDEEYLNLNIPDAPEMILDYYYSKNNLREIQKLPHPISINRNKYLE
jgi:hypothetical protein